VGVFVDAAHDLILASDPTTGLWIVRPKGLANLCAARRCSFRLGCDAMTDPPRPYPWRWPAGMATPPCG
jgi:hypothetical protein